MLAVLPPVGRVLGGQFPAPQNQKVLSIPFLGRFREIERPGQNSLPVDDHDLVVSNRMPRINEGRDTGMNQERRRRIPLRPLALIEQNLDSYPSLMRFDQRLRNRGTRERVGLHKNGLTRLTQLLHHSLCAAPLW